jgi:Holliday junction resolvase RusA-like endonuclease
MNITIPCNPPKTTGQAAARILKRRDGSMFVGKFASGKGKAAQDSLMSLLAAHRPPSAMQGPISVDVVWVYPWRKSETKRNRAAGIMPCDTRPDFDNLLKMLLDCMTRLGFWNDDGQIARGCLSKWWGDSPGISVSIEQIKSEAKPCQS